MGYTLYNNGASIAIEKDGASFLIMKTAIKKITVIKGEFIRLNTSCCLKSICIPFHAIDSPEFSSIPEIINEISYWLQVIERPPRW